MIAGRAKARRPQEVSVGPPLKVKQLLQRDPNVRPGAREAGLYPAFDTLGDEFQQGFQWILRWV